MVVTRYAVMDSAKEGGLKRVLRIGLTIGARRWKGRNKKPGTGPVY
jgi:hypothetical protein